MRSLDADAGSVCDSPCNGVASGCDAFARLGMTCLDLETDEYIQDFGATCDCSGCSLCDEEEKVAPPHCSCADGTLPATLFEVETEAALTAAVTVGGACRAITLTGDVALHGVVSFRTAARVRGSGSERRPALSPAENTTHRLVAVLNHASVSLTSLVLRDGFDNFTGGCVFVSGGSSLTLNDSVLENCGASGFGGGVAVWSAASLRVHHSTFEGCSAGFMGGSIYGHGRSFVEVSGASSVRFSGAFSGGGIAVTTAAQLILSEESHLYECSATFDGGAVFAGKGARAFFTSGSVVACSHSGGRGGGIFSDSGTVVLEGRSTLVNCTAQIGGGAMLLNSRLNASDCSFVGCVATVGDGGGVTLVASSDEDERSSACVLSNVEFRNCGAEGSGGGIALSSAAAASVFNSSFSKCSAGAHGGAIAAVVKGGVVSLSSTSVLECQAGEDGGGLYLGQSCRASVDASRFSDNACGGFGGALAANAGSILALFGGSLVERNVAAVGGGGLALKVGACASAAAAVVFRDNTALTGDGGAATVAAGASFHLGRAVTFSRNVAATDGGAVHVSGQGARLFVAASVSTQSCGFERVVFSKRWGGDLSVRRRAKTY